MVRLSVAQLLPALDGGGVERGTLEIAEELVRRGHRSVVISAGGRLVPELLQAGSEHLAWPLGATGMNHSGSGQLPLSLGARFARPAA